MDKTLACPSGIQISSYIRQQGLTISTPCGGRGNCGKCRIKIINGWLPVMAMDRVQLSEDELEQGVRLACQAMPDKEVRIEIL